MGVRNQQWVPWLVGIAQDNRRVGELETGNAHPTKCDRTSFLILNSSFFILHSDRKPWPIGHATRTTK
ncbi:MAG: hypothetical protein F6K56_25755 [Moorea sp. SIO3G5]|nr:hypothetical protein [Moorena sp. SIO3G5]